jgi:hypothetical protein
MGTCEFNKSERCATTYKDVPQHTCVWSAEFGQPCRVVICMDLGWINERPCCERCSASEGFAALKTNRS